MQGMKKSPCPCLRSALRGIGALFSRAGGAPRWVKRSAALLALGMLGTLAFALRPAFVPDSAETLGERAPTVPARIRDARDTLPPLDIAYTWDLQAQPTGTLVMGAQEPDAFSLLREARWDIRLRQEGGVLTVSAAEPLFHAADSLCAVRARFSVKHAGRTLQRMPNGREHILYHIVLLCDVSVQPPFWQPAIRTLAMQELVLDPVDSAADLSPHPDPAHAYAPWVEGRPFPIQPVAGLPPYRLISSNSPSGLPERYCGSPRQRQLTRIVYTMADFVSSAQVRLLLPGLERSARELAGLLPEPGEPWPQCWGGEAAMARQLSQRLAPVLSYLQENDCFGSQALADFINGEDFGKLFGGTLREERAEQ